MADQEEPCGAKRQQIIDGAEIVFTECGYEGASMSRIALRASVSKGTLYNYFTGKSELFAAFVEQKATVTLSQVFEPLDGQDDMATTLHKIGLRMVDVVLSPGSLVLYRIVVSEAGKFPQLAQIYWTNGPERAIAQMSAWLAQQMQAGRLREVDPAFAAEQFFALCQTRYGMKRRLQLILEISAEDVEMVVAGAVRLFLDSYSPSPSAKPLATLNTRS
ncbi:TetR/AcrR family transcriptional regulator [Lichenicola cladoniae]|uniref:TetR/AcrR family transcriptional regulator n=1 Tax=Lichenicola cladoniae TaxID=1484109 RepID=A0A6M8HQ17_9PROT|nr:TetR/AcrR family transcriptional regulator [Lichenicola cladoniae]NPD66370.1 TetR/AcrR family transcriptional regulator [Acetobacteraceae bacterium]QKE90387.1 TetR/AcrR family transcriptional regulator [Lichenicola cladoniae]